MKGCSNHDVKYSCIDKVQYSDNYKVSLQALMLSQLWYVVS